MFDVIFLGAFTAGLLSFLSACMWSKVPFYLSYLAGVSMNQVTETALVSGAVRPRAFIAACRFAPGILHRQFQAEVGDTSYVGLFGAYVIGLAFAFGWTPRVGPVLAAILFVAGAQEASIQGAMLPFSYEAGMTAPFILAALFIGPFMHWMYRFRRHLGKIEKAIGLMLIALGVLIATNSINYIANGCSRSFRSLGPLAKLRKGAVGGDARRRHLCDGGTS